jgi:argininosuccinate lyase
MPAIVQGAELNREAIAARLEDGFLDATALMEYLIKRGVPMRTGHEVVGKLVADCEKRGCRLKDLKIGNLQTASSLIDEKVYDVLGAKNAAAALVSYGSGGPEQVRQRLAEWQQRVGK